MCHQKLFFPEFFLQVDCRHVFFTQNFNKLVSHYLYQFFNFNYLKAKTGPEQSINGLFYIYAEGSTPREPGDTAV